MLLAVAAHGRCAIWGGRFCAALSYVQYDVSFGPFCPSGRQHQPADLWFARPLVFPRFRPHRRSLCVFEDVHSLPCSHRFCRECIMGCFKSSKRQECPLCKVRGDC